MRVKTNLKRMFVFLAFSISAITSFAEITETLSTNDITELSKEYTATTLHKPVIGAASIKSSLLPIGVETSLVAGPTTTETFSNKLGKSFSSLPYAGVLLSGALPFGIGAELVFFPKLESRDVKYEQYSVGAKWVLTDVFLTSLPLNFAFRGHYSYNSLDYSGFFANSSTNFLSVLGNLEAENKAYGVDFMTSLNLLFLEVYAGAGFVHNDFKLNADLQGSGNLFQTGIGQQTVSGNSPHFMGGVLFSFLLARFGLQVDQTGNSTSYTAKVGLGF